MKENNMKKFAYVLAAFCAMAIAAPTIASAETLVIKHGNQMHRDHGLHRDHGWRHHDKMVIIKHRHHEG